MPQKSKVQKLKKTQRLSLFCTTNTESATMNCDPKNNDQNKASKRNKKTFVLYTVHAELKF